MADQMNWHGKALGDKGPEVVAHLKAQLKLAEADIKLEIPPPVKDAPTVSLDNIKLSEPPAYKLGQAVATREAYGTALVKIAQNNDRVVGLDGDMKNSTFSQNLRNAFPERHVECFICEQSLVGVSWLRMNPRA